MSSTTGSKAPPAEAVKVAAVVTQERPRSLGPALARLERVAEECRVELVHPEAGGDGVPTRAQLAVVLGGDGTMLRALTRFLGTGVPVIGVNFGRVGFLASIAADELEAGVARAFSGDYRVAVLPTLEVEAGGERRVAVNDVVATSSTIGRMIDLAWAIGEEDLGVLSCDGVICCTPSGSTAYNLSNGGPVLVWGLDAMAITFVAPHSLHARPLVVPRGRTVSITNQTADGGVTVLVDGQRVREAGPGEAVTIRVSDDQTLLATLPEATFVRRYRETFGG